MMIERAPCMETARLRMRPHRADDFDDAYAMWRDPLVTRYIGGKPSTEQQVWSRILNYAGQWALLGFGYWAVEEKASGKFVGELGFANFRRDIDARMRNAPELGWAFASPVHGRGFATEALQAVVTWGDVHLPGHRTVCLIEPENYASRRLARTYGFGAFLRTEINERPIMFFERIFVSTAPETISKLGWKRTPTDSSESAL